MANGGRSSAVAQKMVAVAEVISGQVQRGSCKGVSMEGESLLSHMHEFI